MTDTHAPSDSNPTTENEDVTVETDWRDADDLTFAVAEAIASARDVAPDEIEPIYESVNLEAVSKLFASADESTRPVQVSFSYDEFWIRIEDDGSVELRSR